MTTSRSFKWVGFSLALLLLWSPLSLAQAPGGGRAGRGARQPRLGRGMGGGFTMDKASLLRSEQVQEELKVTEEQMAKVQEAVAASREAARASRGERPRVNFRDMSEEERAEWMENMRKERQESMAAMDKKLAEVLKKEQFARLEQIWVQQMGVQALKNETIAKKLKVTDEQTEKIDAAIAWGREQQTGLFEGMRDLSREERQEAFQKMQEKRAKIEEQVKEKAMAALSKEQQEQMKKLCGKKFELDMQSFRGMRGGFRGGRQRGEGGARPEGERGGRRRRPQPEGGSEGASTI